MLTSPTTDIQSLFTQDPLKLTRTDITAIVEEMRRSRASFNLGNLRAGSTKVPAAKKEKLTDLAELDL